ncbi:aspartate carbamoyltransferase [Candidatus Woesearchaeota archaeon]|nr:aspartate carbamoyltransferase [Candidatus Woesearchaeota archaeon]
MSIGLYRDWRWRLTKGFPAGKASHAHPYSLPFSHILSAKQFTKPTLDTILSKAAEMESLMESKGGSSALRGKIMATLFYEPSTRTRLSFESSMLRLGGSVIGTENAKEFSSASKGETLQDTIRVLNGYCDIIVMRHYEKGAAAKAAEVSGVPVINAGDGPGEHPTQALLDLYTIKREFGEIEGKKVAFVGDLKYGRTVRSLAQLLAHYKGAEIFFVAPPNLAVGEDIKDLLRERGFLFHETEKMEEVLPVVDVLYMTRIQKERFASEAEYLKSKGVYVLDSSKVDVMKKGAVIMHPLPRVDEITLDVDSNPRARYFDQARKCGVYVRMALLDMLLNK